MAGFTTSNNDHLIRSQIWSTQIKEILEDELMGMKYVDWVTDFNDGDLINIPSIGQAEAQDYVEDSPIRYTAMDTGNFQFSINKYMSSGTYITNKMKQDTFYLDRLVSKFVPSQARAIAVEMETDLLAKGPDGQTASDLNSINGAAHRFCAQGSGNKMSIDDFNYAKYALQKAKVPMTNLVAIVDPSVELEFGRMTNVVNLANPNRHWENVVVDGMSTGTRFVMNIFGFDVYVSDYLKKGITETIDSQSCTSGVANLFFSATSDVIPLIGHVRQAPKVDSEYNKDFQREEYVTTARWGFKLYRPENFVTIISEGGTVTPTYTA